MTRPQDIQPSRVQSQLQGQNHSAFSFPGGVAPENQLISYRKNPYSLHGFYLKLAIEAKESGQGLEVLWDAPPVITQLPAQEGFESLIKEYREQYRKLRKHGKKDYEYLGNYSRRRPIDYLISEQNRYDNQYPRVQYELAALKLDQKPIDLANTKPMTVGMIVILKRQFKDERNQMYLMGADQQRWPQSSQSQSYSAMSSHAASQTPYPGHPQPGLQGHSLPGAPPQGPTGPPMNSGAPSGAPHNQARPVNQPPPPPPPPAGPGSQQRPFNPQKGLSEPQNSKGAKEARSNSSKRKEQDIRIIQSRDRDDISSSNEGGRFRDHDDDDSDYDDRGRDDRYEVHKPHRSSSRSRGRKSQDYLRTRPKSPGRRSSMSERSNAYTNRPQTPLGKALARRDSVGPDHRRSPRTSASYLPRESSGHLPRAPELPKGQVVNITIQANDRQSRETRRHSDSGTAIDEHPYNSYGYSSSGSERDYDDAGSSGFSGHGGSDFTTSSPSSSGSFHDHHHYGGQRGSLYKPTKDRPKIHRALREHSKPPPYITPASRDNQSTYKYQDDVEMIPGVTYMPKRRNSTHYPVPRRLEHRGRLSRNEYGPETARDDHGYMLHPGPPYAPYSYREHPDDWQDDYFPEAMFDHEQPIRRPIRRRQMAQRSQSYNDYVDERGGWE